MAVHCCIHKWHCSPINGTTASIQTRTWTVIASSRRGTWHATGTKRVCTADVGHSCSRHGTVNARLGHGPVFGYEPG
eukprot:1081788-Rhodomonas_salina.2